ncbi:HTH-type transcriptional regulator CysB [Thiohalorhabdus methylotrophus]|uniref:HTH-type transcriptional regulator CysB n=1 Tax=Thiohalorhabdus methylotrophus TaxID=3242694 RepID=A0ABV4TUX8_9GAMM
MTLRQLQFFREVVRTGFNVTAAAERLFTSQPGISKQLRLLEEELGLPLFARSGRQLSHLTPAGEAVLAYAERALREITNIKQVATEYREPGQGTLTLATTHTQARYALPETIRRFRELHPEVRFRLHQGTPQQIAGMLVRRETDLAIATESLHLFEGLVLLPCYLWNRCLVVPPGHPLTEERPVTLERLAAFPLVTYVFGLTGQSRVSAAFEEQGLEPEVVLAATDAEVIKTYVRAGMGVGIVARMALESPQDDDLVALDAGHLFDPSITSIAFRSEEPLRGFTREFIRIFAPHLTAEVLDRAERAEDPETLQGLFNELVAVTELP